MTLLVLSLRDNYLNEFVQALLLTDVVNNNLLLFRNNCSLRKNLITQSADDILIKICKLLQHWRQPVQVRKQVQVVQVHDKPKLLMSELLWQGKTGS